MKDEQLIEKKEGVETLVPVETYLTAGVHIGTKHKTKYMEKYIYKIRPDGLCILNVSQIDERLKALSDFINKAEKGDVVIISRRENGKKAAKLFNLATGIKTVTGRYLPGTLTNPNFESFMEPKIIVITDIWYDKQALHDALNSNIEVIAFCDTNNNTNDLDVVIPCNNKGRKSLGLIFYILAKEYCKAKSLPFNYTVEQFS